MVVVVEVAKLLDLSSAGCQFKSYQEPGLIFYFFIIAIEAMNSAQILS